MEDLPLSLSDWLSSENVLIEYNWRGEPPATAGGVAYSSFSVSGQVLGYASRQRPSCQPCPCSTAGQTSPCVLGELQCIDHTQHFIDIATERQVIDDLMANDALLIDQEGAAEGDAGRTELDVIHAADLVLHIGDQRVLNLTDAAVVDRGVLPREVGELRIDRYADDLDAALLKLGQAVVERDQFDGQTNVKSSG